MRCADARPPQTRAEKAALVSDALLVRKTRGTAMPMASNAYVQSLSPSPPPHPPYTAFPSASPRPSLVLALTVARHRRPQPHPHVTLALTSPSPSRPHPCPHPRLHPPLRLVLALVLTTLKHISLTPGLCLRLVERRRARGKLASHPAPERLPRWRGGELEAGATRAGGRAWEGTLLEGLD